MNSYAKSRVCSSKNGRVIALGTKEDTSLEQTRAKGGVQTLSTIVFTLCLLQNLFKIGRVAILLEINVKNILSAYFMV